jgi:ketosteroid isomerase-like protein
MLKIITLPFFVIIILLSCNSKEKADNGIKPKLIQLNSLYDSAIVHSDTSVLKRLYAPEFVYTNSEGKLLTKDQQIVNVATSEMKWEAGKSENVKVNVFGNAAVMTGSFFANGTYRGNPVTINESYTEVWIKKDTSWQMVAEQGTIVK